jgi:CRISPR-associated endoribonuclease Cas6
MLSEYNPTRNDFSFQHVRFDFDASVPQDFPEGKAGNVFRGALGWALREVSPAGYASFFEPCQLPGVGPSGFANRPRPFVLRAGHLDGRTFQAGEPFHVDLHLFKNASFDLFHRAMERIRLGRLVCVNRQVITLSLENTHPGITSVSVCFVTPTELKTAGTLTHEPDFPVLFSRTRDRIRALCQDELTLDFSGMAQRANNIALVSQRLIHERFNRTSRKTGQTHPIGGFRGEAFYAGDLDEFAPLLEAARWTGIGRQTVWGKGAIELRYKRA